MAIIGINGSPRKNKNSALLLTSALDGAKSAGAETVLTHLSDLQFSGCVSCFACKRIGGVSFGQCVVKDDLQPLLTKVLEADALILSVPVYFGDVPGMVRNFMERLWFPGLMYKKDRSIAYTKRVKVGLIYTMNAPEASMYDALIQSNKASFSFLLGPTEVLSSTDTLQYDNYDHYVGDMFDASHKQERHAAVFPKDRKRAFTFGETLARP